MSIQVKSPQPKTKSPLKKHPSSSPHSCSSLPRSLYFMTTARSIFFWLGWCLALGVHLGDDVSNSSTISDGEKAHLQNGRAGNDILVVELGV